MKRFLALFLALVMVFGMVPSMGTTAKAETAAPTEEATAKPFYGLAWSPVDMSMFGNIEDAPVMIVYNNNNVVSTTGSSNYAAYAAEVKATLDALPEGMRYIRMANTGNALAAGAELVVYADAGMAQLKALVTEFIEEYYKIGGQLDGIILDTEYTAMGAWYIYSDTWGGYYEPSDEKIQEKGYNRNIYNDIVNHPKYATDIRPLLEERGFTFYENTSGNQWRSEIWSTLPPQTVEQVYKDATRTEFEAKYGNCYSIWNRVMNNRIAAYLTDAVYNPMADRYPNATVSDYTVTDTATWENYMSESGSVGNAIGNANKVGNTSNENMYNSNPSSSFFKDGDTYLYKNILSYNEAVYDDDAYGSLMFNVNRFKSIYASTDTKKISAWIAEYDYSGRNTSVKNSPYYTEFMYHLGMLDPQPFLIYMYTGADKFSETEGKIKYNQRMDVISQILNELTRVAGYSDRKPIETPQSWNDGFMLSGMYANGRNIWRLTPDTTDGKTLADFKVAGSDPTFSINGNTVTFPGGSIITDSTIDSVGSCGYWIETAADVQPVITREADRYAKNPSFGEDFESFASGDVFNSPHTTPLQVWSNDIAMISSTVSLSGAASQSFTVPTAVTSASIQSWEMKFTIPYSKSTSDAGITTQTALTETAQMVFLTCGTDGGIKIVNNQVYYDANGSYALLEGVTLTPGNSYRVRRVVDFNTNTCDYSIHNGTGSLVAQVKDVPMKAGSQPVATLGASVSDFQATTTKTDADGNVTSTTTANATLKITAASANIPLFVEEYAGSKALALTGTAALDNVKIPKNITAGDSYAMQQAWELSFTLDSALNSGNVTLFNGLVKLENNKIYYNQSGSYQELAAITAGTKYTICVNNNFADNTATYTLSADGAVAANAENVAVTAVTLPVSTISMAANGVSAKVLIDDYKLYPTGLEYGIKFYDGDSGLLQSATEKLTNDKVAFRLSWMNATAADTKGQIRVVRYDNSGNEVSDTVLRSFEMKAYWDGVETGVLENTTGKLSVYLHICQKDNTELQGKLDATCTTDGYTGDLVCKDCGEIYEEGEVISSANAHKKVTIPGKAATCTTNGLTAGEQCEVCGEILKAQEEIPAAHKELVVAGVAATCTTDGKTEGKRCSVCREWLVPQEVIPAGHTEVVTPGKDATCMEEGLTEGRECSVCGEVLAVQTVIPATGHTAGEAVQENATATSYDLVVKCSGCGEELSRVAVKKGTVTLFGTSVTIDTDATTEAPEALYWVNGEEGAAPVAATAEDEWNYSFTIVEGIPTVTIRNAEYTYTATCLSAKYNGSLKLVYEGTNNITVPYNSTKNADRYFVSFASTTNSAGYGKFYIEGADDAVLNVDGGDNSASMLSVSNKAYLTISGGTLNITKTNAGGVNSAIGAAYSKTVIENCTLNVKLDDGVGGKHPAVTLGGSGSGTVTINNANVNIQTNAHTGLCVGVFQANMQGVLYASTLTITGNSNVKVVTKANSSSDYAYNGVGIYASKVTIKGGNVEAEGNKQAVYGTVDLSAYAGNYAMFTAKDGEAVTEYAATTYFKVKYLCDHEEQILPGKDATCSEPGLTEGKICTKCGEHTVEQEVIEALGHTEQILPGKDATCTEPGLTEGKICTVCGETLTAQTEIEALGHTEEILAAKDATCTEDGLTEGKICTTCGETLIAQDVILAPGHIAEIAPAKDATCTVDGLSEGVTCSVCGEAIVAQTVIPATGHTASDPVKENITETNYESVVYCATCHEVISRTTISLSSATVTLFGTAVTVDNDDATADVPEALYWVNGEGDAVPVEATAADNWNYRFMIIEGVPTVTIRDADYSYAKTFLSATYDGKLKLAYEGTNTVYVQYKASSGYAFISYSAATNTAGKGHLYIEAAEGASLNVTGGSKGVTMLGLSKKAYLTVTGGTINIERTNAGGVYGVLSATYGKVVIKNCVMHLKDMTSVAGKHPLVSIGNGTSYGLTITDSDVTMESNAYITLSMGVFQSNMNGVLYPATVTINGDSNVKIINASNNTGSTYAYNGVGIWGRALTVNGGSLEVDAAVKAVHLTATDAIPSIPDGYYLYTEKGGEAVETYAVSTYFKAERACEHTDVTTTEEITLDATCQQAGSKTVTVTCKCGEVISTETVEIPALGHIPVAMPGKDATCIESGLTAGKSCLRCGEALVAQTVIPALGHTYDDVTDINCNTCGAARPTITVDGNNVSVHLNGVTSAKTHTFYVEGKNIADINNWSELKATGTLKSYSAYEFVLVNAGDYVLRLEYVADGVRQVTSYPVTIENTDDTSEPSCKPEFTVKDNIVRVEYNGATNMKVHAFYVEGKEVADINYWSALKAADPNYKTYSKDIIPLTKVGRYILRAEYTDTTGAKNAESFEVTVDCVPVSVTVAQQNVTVNIDGATNVKVFAFFVEEGESVSNIYDWNQLKAVDPDFKTYVRGTFKLPEIGKYVLRVQYINANGETMAVSFMAVTSLIVPEVTNSGNKIKLTTNGLTVQKIHVFYVEGKDIADINDWNELKSEAASYKAYSKTPFTVKKSGKYVMRIEFIDRTGSVNKVSQLIDVQF